MLRKGALVTLAGAGALALLAGPAGAAPTPGAAPAVSSPPTVSQLLPPDPPAPGPNRCSVDINGRTPGTYSAADNVVTQSYDLSGPQCKDGWYALVVLNGDDERQRTVFLVRGDGISRSVTFKQRLSFRPAVQAGVPAGHSLCVVAVTARAGRIQDVAPDQDNDLLTTLRTPECDPLGGGTARAFH
jgi:hypothetical protein